MSQPNSHKKVLTATDVTLYTVSAILLIDQIAMSAAVGPSAIFWWIVILLLFFLPNTLITAELGATYPEQGGIYAWVRDAFGTRFGARIAWLYWINIALWMPAVFIMFSGIFATLFAPEMSLTAQIALGVFLCSVTALINCLALKHSKWIPILGTPAKLIVFLTFAIAGLYHGIKNGFVNDMSFSLALENPMEGLSFLPVIVYGCLGIELVCSESDEIRDPSKNIPKAMFTAGLLTAVLYIISTAGVLSAVPAEEIDMVDIIAVSLKQLFGGSAMGDLFALVIGGLTLYTLFSTIVTWTLGGNRAMAEAAEAKEMPVFFAWTHKQHQAPIGAAIMASVISSSILILYGVMANNAEDLFWNLFSFSAIIFLTPYIAMHLAFIKLRLSDGKRYRPFKVPGGFAMGLMLSILCISILSAAIALFFWVPGSPFDFTLLLQVGGSVIITLIIGEVLVRLGEKAKQSEQQANLAK